MPLLHKGDVVGDGGRYTVLRKLGEGQFAEVWEVRPRGGDGGRQADARLALKLEKRKDRNTVKQEYKALRKLGPCAQVVPVEGCGVHDERFFMVMQLLGESLYDARKARPCGRFGLATVRSVGLSTLAAIKQVHDGRLLHRDIKPANFAISPAHAAPDKGQWLLLDFGLARRYTDDAGAHLPPRADASFRGSTAYASVHAHRDEDLSRRDDLWSWLYMMAELLDGSLPWRHEKEGGEHVQADKHWVQQQKEACMREPHLLTRSVPLPEPLAAISSHLSGLGFSDPPDYQHLRQCLEQLPSQEESPPAGQAHEAHHEQQQQQQQPMQLDRQWDAPAVNGAQHSQQQHLLTPASPLQERRSPARHVDAPAAKRSHSAGPGAGLEGVQVVAKKPRADLWSSGLPPKPSTGGSHQHHHQQQQQRAGSGSLLQSPASPPVGAEEARPQHDAAGTQGPGRGANASPSAKPSSPLAAGPGPGQHAGGAGSAAAGRQARPCAAGDGGWQQPPGVSPGGGGGRGRAGEIADLLAAVTAASGGALAGSAQQAAAGLCSLSPAEAVAAIGITLDRLVRDSEAACLPAVAQLLLDLAAYASSGAARALRGGAAAAGGAVAGGGAAGAGAARKRARG